MGWADGERHLRTHGAVCRVAAPPSARRIVAGLALTLGLLLGACTQETGRSGAPSTAAAGQASTPSTTRTADEPSASSPSAMSSSARPSGSSTASTTPTPALVASATWVTRSGVRAAKIVPTAAGRVPRVDPETVWAQVVGILPGVDTPGMRDQLVCHVTFAPGKSAWFLEPGRPAVGYAATVAAGCNPGALRDAG
ncbi:MAG: DUF2599 domain-containing protein [Dermatophilaceae bacterium]